MGDDFETIIGLECHVELSTATKMFCGCVNEFGAPPNTHTCPVCLGHPGSLPVPNRAAIEATIKIGLALGVSDVRMEEGSLRCDCNISTRPAGHKEYGTKVEIKNLNSIRSLYNAVRYEEERQRRALRDGEPLVQETRHWDEDRGVTSTLRSKEYAFDYRYFPEPDLPPVEPSAQWIEEIRASLPELPQARRARYESLGLKPAAARQLATPEWWRFFQEALELGAEPAAAANWITQDVAGLLNEHRVELADSRLTAQHVADLVRLAADATISSAGAKQALAEAFETGKPIEDIVDERGLKQVSDTSSLEPIIDEVIAENPKQV